MNEDTHQADTQSFQQVEYEMMIMTARWYSGTFVDLKFPDICHPGKCPDRGSDKWRDCDVGEAKEGLQNELWRRWSNGKFAELAFFIFIIFIFISFIFISFVLF